MDDAALLVDALGVERGEIRMQSREPLGAGSVAGFDVGRTNRIRYYVDTSLLRVAEDTRPYEEPENEARIWLHPSDPHLPALAPVAFESAAETLLARLGVAAIGAPEFVTYRPGRRAVLKIPVDGGAVWVKVVRPSRVARIVDAHAASSRAGIPVPEVMGWSSSGLMVLAGSRGIPVADSVWNAADLLDEVDTLRQGFATVSWTLPASDSLSRLEWYSQRVEGDAAGVIPVIRAELQSEASSHRPLTVIHGDLHFGQLFLDDAQHVSGVIDIDTLGVGDPAEDAAAFLAHAIASALLTEPTRRQRVWELADAAMSRWGDDSRVRALAALHLVGHALAATDRGESGETLVAAARIALAQEAPSSCEQS